MAFPRVLLVAEHTSARFGGEAILPLHYFRELTRRGVPTWLITHARTRQELLELFPEHADRIHFVPDTRAHRAFFHASKPLPSRLARSTVGYAGHVLTQRYARQLAKTLIADLGIDIVHQPIPVSPKEPSLLHDLGVPVVMGPMNGGMSYPPAFRHYDGALTVGFVSVARKMADFANRLAPGKLRASTLLVANERTRQALPRGVSGRVVEMPENGVDLSLFVPAEPSASPRPRPLFVFVGRLVEVKAVDLLLEAFKRSCQHMDATLELIGDGPLRSPLEALTRELGLCEKVTFRGWLPQAETAARLREVDALILPSLMECGGAVVLEAMACGLPVIATAWGGPLDYLDDSCGYLVAPSSREALIDGFARAMTELADSGKRAALGAAGRQRVLTHFDWEQKIDQMLQIYADAMARYPAN